MKTFQEWINDRAFNETHLNLDWLQYYVDRFEEAGEKARGEMRSHRLRGWDDAKDKKWKITLFQIRRIFSIVGDATGGQISAGGPKSGGWVKGMGIGSVLQLGGGKAIFEELDKIENHIQFWLEDIPKETESMLKAIQHIKKTLEAIGVHSEQPSLSGDDLETTERQGREAIISKIRARQYPGQKSHRRL